MNKRPDKTSETQEITSRIFTGSSDGPSDDNQNLLRGNGGDITVRAKMVRVEDGATIRATSVGITKVAPDKTLQETQAAVQEAIMDLPEAVRPRAGNLTIDAESIMVTGARTIGGDILSLSFQVKLGLELADLLVPEILT